jgi:phage gp29-like protein
MGTIVDQCGRVMETTRRPDANLVAVAPVQGQSLTYPSRGLTPERLTSILQEADEGKMTRFCELGMEMQEKDAHLASLFQTRVLAVMGLPWDVKPCPTEPGDKAAAKEAAEASALCQRAMDGLDVEDLITDLLDALGKGYSIAEIQWRIAADVMPTGVTWVEPQRFVWTGNVPRLLTDKEPQDGEVLPANKFLVHVHKGRSGWPSRAGLLRTCAWLYLFKAYSIKDWMQYCETYGIPLRLGKYPTNATPDEKTSLLEALVSIASNAAGIIPDTASIEFILAGKSQGGSSADVFEKMITWCEHGQSKTVLGQTTSSDAQSGSGTLAGNAHAKVRNDLIEADATSLAKTIRRDLFRAIVGFNMGWDVADRATPYLWFDSAEPEDEKAQAETLGILVEKVRLRVPASYVREKFGIPAPEGDEELVGAPDAPANDVLPLKRRLPPGSLVNKAAPATTDPTQEALNHLGDVAIEESAGAVRSLTSTLLAAVETATDYDDLRDKLLAAYPSMEAWELSNLMARAMHMAGLGGRTDG